MPDRSQNSKLELSWSEDAVRTFSSSGKSSGACSGRRLRLIPFCLSRCLEAPSGARLGEGVQPSGRLPCAPLKPQLTPGVKKHYKGRGRRGRSADTLWMPLRRSSLRAGPSDS